MAGEEGLVEGDCLVGELGLDFLSFGLEWLSEEGVRGKKRKNNGFVTRNIQYSKKANRAKKTHKQHSEDCKRTKNKV